MKYIIIDIEDNYGGTDGHVIVVKANPVKVEGGFSHLMRMFGKKYVSYPMNETEETEIFIFPFSEGNKANMIRCARAAEQKHDFWEPIEEDFYEATLSLPNGRTKQVKKHVSFKTQTEETTFGIKQIVDNFKFSDSLIGIFKGGENIFDVKSVPLKDGSFYSGKALQMGNICMPNGYGIKVFKDKGNTRIGSFCRGGRTGKIIWASYPDYLYAGCAFDEEPNGWGFKLAKGQFTFGYYKEGKLYKDMSPFATDVYLSMTGKGLQVSPVEAEVCRIAVGRQPKGDRNFIGFQFLENGTVYLGEASKNNTHCLTGHFICFDIDGKVRYGIFDNGKLVRPMSQKEYFNSYGEKSDGQDKVDTTTNYLDSPSCRKFLITNMQTRFHFDMGPIISICAQPFDKLKITADGNVRYDNKNAEHFYLHDEESIARIIQENAQQNRLWLVNLDDFNTHYDSIINLSTDQVEYKNFHLHNALIGLNYSNITNFDTNHVMDRLGI